jgi:hypothetical protein
MRRSSQDRTAVGKPSIKSSLAGIAQSNRLLAATGPIVALRE